MTQEYTPASLGPYDIQRIMTMLPHRYPFLMVDRVEEIVPQKYIKAYKNVSINEPFFQGHFPGFPVMPGVMILESMAQAGGILVLSDREDLMENGNLFLFTGIENVKFRRPVVPGDKLELHSELVRHKMRLWKMRGTAHVNGVLACEAEMTAAIMPKESI